MESPLKIYEHPRLREPYLVIGWEDTGHVGTGVADYLIDKLGAEEFGEIEPYDFSYLPNAVVKGGVLEDIEYPENGFYFWKNKKGTNDLIILGTEPPSHSHHEFANLVLDVAELFNVKRIYAVGGLPANITHGEEPRLLGVVNSSRLKKYLKSYNIEVGMDYQGPTSMNGLILGLAKQRNIDGLSLWGWVPSYIGDIPNPRVSEAVLRVLTQMLNVNIDFSDIEVEVRQASKQIDEIVSYIRQQSPDLDRHIGKLEKRTGGEFPQEDRRRIFRDIEEFLRRQEGEQK